MSKDIYSNLKWRLGKHNDLLGMSAVEGVLISYKYDALLGKSQTSQAFDLFYLLISCSFSYFTFSFCFIKFKSARHRQRLFKLKTK